MFWTPRRALSGYDLAARVVAVGGLRGSPDLGSRGRRVPLEDGRSRDLVREASELFGAAGEVDQHIVDTG